MNENDQPDPDASADSRFDEELRRLSAEAAHRLITQDDEANWEPVNTESLDPSQPLSDRERRIVTDDAKALFASHNRHHEDTERIRSLEADARIDKMTGLRTHKVFEDDLPRMLALAEREHSVVAVWQIDGAGLKKVNDNISRQAGDDYIKAIAEALERTVRKSDGVYRGGGESDEFFVLMPHVQEHGDEIDEFLGHKAEDFRNALLKLAQEKPSLTKAIGENWLGLSIGVTSRDFSEPWLHRSVRELADELVTDADRLMRFDKKRHRLQAAEKLRSIGQEVPEDDRLY